MNAVDGIRRPAILLRSSPHKYETEDTPWIDDLNSESGNIIFFGDNKRSDRGAMQAKGNSALLEQLALQSRDNKHDRNLAAPILLFASISRNGIQKGQVKFCGLIRLLSLEKIIQINPLTRDSFENFKFTFYFMDLVAENEDLDWGWINDRRNPNLNLEMANRRAPKSWIKFLD